MPSHDSSTDIKLNFFVSRSKNLSANYCLSTRFFYELIWMEHLFIFRYLIPSSILIMLFNIFVLISIPLSYLRVLYVEATESMKVSLLFINLMYSATLFLNSMDWFLSLINSSRNLWSLLDLLMIVLMTFLLTLCSSATSFMLSLLMRIEWTISTLFFTDNWFRRFSFLLLPGFTDSVKSYLWESLSSICFFPLSLTLSAAFFTVGCY